MAFPSYISEVHKSITVVVIVLFVVQLCALVVEMEYLNWLMVAMDCLLVVPLVVLMEMVLVS